MAAPKIIRKDPVRDAVEQQVKETAHVNRQKEILRILVRNFRQLQSCSDHETVRAFGKGIADFVSKDQHTVAAAASLFCDEFYIEYGESSAMACDQVDAEKCDRPNHIY